MCLKCRQEKDSFYFAKTSSPFFPKGRSIICTPCLEAMVRPEEFDQIDRLCRYLDIPFDLDSWTSLYEIHKEKTLTAYLEFLADESYSATSWKVENDRWLLARERKTIDEEIAAIDKAHFIELRKKWSDSYKPEELLYLEDLYNKVAATQNVSTPILQNYAADYCEISLLIKKGLREGLDVKKLMDSRDNIIKIANFDAKNAKNVSDFDSVGELIVYCVKKGWHPNWARENQDVVDMTMQNIQQYLKRLVMNEGNLAEQVEGRREAFNTAQRLEDDALSNGAIKLFEDSDIEINYEDEEELARELTEWDI